MEPPTCISTCSSNPDFGNMDFQIRQNTTKRVSLVVLVLTFTKSDINLALLMTENQNPSNFSKIWKKNLARKCWEGDYNLELTISPPLLNGSSRNSHSTRNPSCYLSWAILKTSPKSCKLTYIRYWHPPDTRTPVTKLGNLLALSPLPSPTPNIPSSAP